MPTTPESYGLPSPGGLSLSNPNASILDDFTRDFERLQQQKVRQQGGVESRVLTNLALYYGEHHLSYAPRTLVVEPHDSNKLYLVFNLLAQRAKKFMGRVFTAVASGKFTCRPDKRDPKALAQAEIIEHRLIPALDEKVDQPSRTGEILFWLAYGGVAFEYVPWVPNATVEPMPQFDPETGELLFKDILSDQVLPESLVRQQVAMGRPFEHFEVLEEVVPTGEVGSVIYGPLNVFMDASVRSVEDLAPDQAVYIAEVKTLGWILENFGQDEEGNPRPEVLALQEEPGQKDIKIVQTAFRQLGPSSGGTMLQDMIPMVQGTAGENDPPMYVVVSRFQPASSRNPEGRYTVFIPGLAVLRDGPNPYGEIPLVDIHLEPVTTTFWTKDYVTDLIPAQKFINKRISQMGEQANASIYDKLLLSAGVKREDITADEPGPIENAVSEQGTPLVHRLPGPQLPGWFLESINLVIKLLNDIAGGVDLFDETRFPGQLRGPLAVPMLQEILDSEWANFYEHLGSRFARIKQMRLNRVKQFYPPIRTLHYTDRDQRDEVFVFHTEEILRSGTNYSVTIERGTLLPELRALREARVRERLSGPLAVLYMDERTGRLDKEKIAADLHFGDTGREARESQYRKLGQEVVSRLWRGEALPPVLPFWDHGVMLDELEAAMATTEFLSASPQIQQAFFDRHRQHTEFLQQQAERQQQFMEQQMMRNTIAQTMQQVAAQTAAETVQATIGQVRAAAQAARTGQAEQVIAEAVSRGRAAS